MSYSHNLDEAKEYFLPTTYSKVRATDTEESKNDASKDRCCKCCTWKCCGIACIIIILLVGGVVLVGYLYLKNKMTGSASSEDSDEWEAHLSDSVNQITSVAQLSGEYKLVSYDENYEAYLKSMGLPFFVIPLVLASSETLNITATEEGIWSILTINDFVERLSEFTLGEEFTMVWGKNNGIMHNVCHLEDLTTLRCQSEERVKGWNFENVMKFAPGKGMISERHFITENMRTKKYYELVGGSGHFSEEESAGMINLNSGGSNQTSESDSPFSETKEEDEEFWSDGFDDFLDEEW